MHRDSILGEFIFVEKLHPDLLHQDGKRLVGGNSCCHQHELNHSGFEGSECNMEFETLGSKIAKGIMKIIPTDFRRKKISRGPPVPKSGAMLTGRHIVNQIFSFFRINMTRGHTMSLNDLINVELHYDNLKAFNQTWEETLLTLGSDVDENIQQSLHERQKRSLLPCRMFYRCSKIVS